MIDRCFGDEDKRRRYDRGNRISGRNYIREEPRAVYFCIDEAVDGSRPRTEFAVGKLDQIKEAGRPYEPSNSPFVMLYFRAKGRDYHGLAKVAIPKSYQDFSTDLVRYINEVKDELVDQIKQQNPGCEIRGVIAVRGSSDKVVLNMMKKYVRAKSEKIVKYEI
jgi:hypothetical protein